MLLGRILGYRRGMKSQRTSQVLIRVEGVAREQVDRLIGLEVVYRDGFGNEYRGRILARHGNGAVVRASFVPNLPGQAIGNKVELILPQAQAPAASQQ